MDKESIKINYGGYFFTLYSNLWTFIRKVILHIYFIPKRRFINKHNRTNIVNYFDFSKVKVGNYTYGDLNVGQIFTDSYLKIGNYCSIGNNVEFICGNHNINHFSTYPFACITTKFDKKKIKYNQDANWGDLEHKVNGPIIIDDDVRIGTGAKIMSGVHIGQGAVIAAGAVVTKDIPPYAIAGGVPAKVIKYRFSVDKIKKLLQIDYSNIPIKKFREIYPETIKDDFDIDYILKKLRE